MNNQTMQQEDLVLVTGISGYLASWLAKQLLEQGFRVRGTVRSLKNTDQQEKLKQILPNAEYVEADLRSEEGWDKAVEGVKWVFHVASPQAVATEKDRVSGAVNGTKYLLLAAFKTDSVEKVVVTSSEAAIAYGHPSSKTSFSEDDWSDLTNKIGDYFESKTTAEKVAWDLTKDETVNPRHVAVSTINPGLILGPSLISSARYSMQTIQGIIEGKTPMLPDMLVHFVDVRDCVAMHIAIMQDRSTDGNRHLSFGTYAKFIELSRIIQAKYANLGFKPTNKIAPKPLLWVSKFFSGDVRAIYGKLGNEIPYTTKYPDVYKYKYTDLESLVEATVESLIEHKIVTVTAK